MYLGVIPARGGSKGIPRKNLAMLGGRPLLAYTAEAALQSGVLDRVILSTDDQEFADEGRKLGLEVPFLRPGALSGDQVPMVVVLQHALDWAQSVNLSVQALVLLQPTSPLRTARHIQESVKSYGENKAGTLVSVTKVPHAYSPESIMRCHNGNLSPHTGSWMGLLRRQDKPEYFARNGPAILIVDAKTIKAGNLYLDPVIPYVMGAMESIDIDSPEDLELAAKFIS